MNHNHALAANDMVMQDKHIGKRKYPRIISIAIGLFFLAIHTHPMVALSGSDCGVQQVFVNVDGLLKSNRYEEAKAALDSLRNCSDLSDLEKFNRGWLYGRTRDFHTALTIFHSLPANVPDPSTHQYAIALGEFEIEDYKSVVETLKDAQQQGLLDVRSANLLGVSYSKLGLYQEAYPNFGGRAQT